MKFSFNWKNKAASLEADVEGLVEKGMERKADSPPKKTRHQIRQEELRKNKELEHKQQMQYLLILLGMVVFFLVFGVIAMFLGI